MESAPDMEKNMIQQGHVSSAEDLQQNFISPIVSDVLFPSIFGNLFELYKIKNSTRDQIFHERISVFSTITPLHIGVDPEFWLEETARGTLVDTEDPYYEAIELMRSLNNYHTARSKLELLVRTNQTIINIVQNHYSHEVMMGADQLLPLICYITAKANTPNMYSELAFLLDFTYESDMAGELGYT
ncbi:hypothetical protein PROFUN_00049 [Planoprotostelium fungivorum]|uniref:VPS9 domain-containing protein n=1 Tax=Planoprotostelium fungivorum TaxID=1890364 RepID=A0A2P6P0J3_9EUKA|nr:hypothetical protein PROFUN_00049 [Planoprotostelium fungivorum]